MYLHMASFSGTGSQRTLLINVFFIYLDILVPFSRFVKWEISCKHQNEKGAVKTTPFFTNKIGG